jgi:hypothetical protein
MPHPHLGNRLFIWLVVTTLACLLVQPAWSQSNNGRRITAPPVTIGSETIDFGDVPPNTTVVRMATISNNSEQPIRITGVRVSCGCTVAEWPEDWIEPGETAELKLTFESGDLWGPVQRYALLVVEGYNRPLRITTLAHVNTGIRPSREYLPLGQMLRGEITLTSTDGKPFSVRSVSFATPADGDAEMSAPGVIGTEDLDQALLKPALKHRLAFDFSKVEPERLRRWVAIETDHPTAPVVAMHLDNPFAGVDRRRVLWVYGTDHLRLGSVEPGGAIEHEVLLRGLRGAASVQEIRTGDPELAVEVLSEELDPALGLVVKLRFTASEQSQGLRHTELTIRAADFEDAIELMLRVRPAPAAADGLSPEPAR